jgi:Ca2+-transporting ATPase
MQTELGRIARMLEGYEAEPTPLQRKLAQLGKVLVVVCLGAGRHRLRDGTVAR